MVRLACASAVLLAACSFGPSGQSADDDTMCTPGCAGATVTTCPDGVDGPPSQMTCPQACTADPTPRCAGFVPSNLDTAILTQALAATGSLTFPPTAVTLDTEIPGFVDSVTRAPLSFPGVQLITVNASTLVVGVTALTVPDGAIWYGSGNRAVIVVASGDIDVHGTIDFSPGCTLDGIANNLRCGGPGGGDGGVRNRSASGGCGGGQAGVSSSGGAGGGFGTIGGNGAAGGATTVASDLRLCDPEGDLQPLAGGSGGGAGAGMEASGGGGGGAIQLSAYGAVRITGGGNGDAVINVGGAGGFGANDNAGGGGGGSGGAILIEAPTVQIADAALVAAGGGGGGGRGGDDGELGRTDGLAAQGGGSNGGGDGGNGAIDGGNGQAGDPASGGGGGGGGLGRVRIHTLSGGFAIPGTVELQGVFASAMVHLR